MRRWYDPRAPGACLRKGCPQLRVGRAKVSHLRVGPPFADCRRA